MGKLTLTFIGMDTSSNEDDECNAAVPLLGVCHASCPAPFHRGRVLFPRPPRALSHSICFRGRRRRQWSRTSGEAAKRKCTGGWRWSCTLLQISEGT